MCDKKTIAIINGPNLNLLGSREPEIYGHETLDGINSKISAAAEVMGLKCVFTQSNHEGELIDAIHKAATYGGAILNAAAFSHYSLAIRDAIAAVETPFVEVHLSNIYARAEAFRHTSLISSVCQGVISGFGSQGYIMALGAFRDLSSLC